MNQELLTELEQGSKASEIKRKIIAHHIENGPATITELAKILNLSVPTVTKFITDMIDFGCIKDYGKLETTGGRYPILYGLDPDSGYFIGVDVKYTSINIGLIDMVGDMKRVEYDIPFKLESSPERLNELCNIIKKFIEEGEVSEKNILNININLPGRINPKTGFSHILFNFGDERPLSEIISQKIGLRVTIDNDTRGMAYGEYTQGCCLGKDYKHVLYINLSWGLGLGIILDGKIYMGKSGFSGEFGHISSYDNQILCHCGKKGCLETEVSGLAMHRILLEHIQNKESSILSKKVENEEEITFSDIIEACNQEDILCLEILGEMGRNLGRQVATLINIFNPELVIIGGTLSQTGDYLKQAIQTVVRTYSLNLVNRDTDIITACLGEKAGVIGACMMARTRRFSEV
ncbi:ROK family transcriptional regulator [Porphyromonas macacae]|uniref:Glucokinase n=1 Tax=Porphyromonas macacae TaxID=28115 RepID=A0A379DHZ8_9PORP|nr:ROK family transcriptional regulator [Porphyromonas macacae]SUB77976.1 Glucokinase [Porphyromonas macacae]